MGRKRQRFKKNFDGYQSANQLLDGLESQALEVERRARADNRVVTLADLTRVLKIQDTTSDARTIEEWSAKFLEHKLEQGAKPGTMRSHRATHAHLTKFAKLRKLSALNTLTEDVFDAFFKHLRSLRNYHPNTFTGIAKNIEVFLNYATSKGAVLCDPRPKVRRPYSSTKRDFLTFTEFKQLRNFTELQFLEWRNLHEPLKDRFTKSRLPRFDVAERVCDSFCFACMTGLRFSDLHRLTKSHYSCTEFGPSIKFMPLKTNSFKAKRAKELTIGLIPEAVAIIEKYAAETTTTLLPVLAAPHYNRYIKYITEAVGIVEPVEVLRYQNGVPFTEQVPKYETVSSHMARHTFATLSRIFGLDLADLRDMLGHSDLRTTAIYDHLANDYKARKQVHVWTEAMKL